MSEEINKEPVVLKASLYGRDQYGLLNNYSYIFNEDNSVNWRAMIKPEFLYVNKEYFTRFNKPVPTSTEGLSDKQLLIMLGGLKELAKLRGFKRVSYDVNWIKEGYVVAKCNILWKGNFETGGEEVEYEDIGNATTENTDDFCHKFLETMACNRAFVRCVRNFLNIHIVGFDEIDKSVNSVGVEQTDEDLSNDMSILKPAGLLAKLAESKGFSSFELFKGYLRTLWASNTYKPEGVKDWNDYKDIPAKECRKLMSYLETVNADQKSS